MKCLKFILLILCLISVVAAHDLFVQELYRSEDNDQEDTQCSAVINDHPNTWLQYGWPRSATTLQTHALVLIAYHICHGHAVSATYMARAMFYKYEPYRLQIIKTHRPQVVGHINQTMYLFGSAFDKDNQMALESDINNYDPHKLPFAAVQYLSDVKDGSYLMVKRTYSSMFNLTDRDVTRISTMLDMWSELRICCGPQMSKSWRAFLWLPAEKQAAEIRNAAPDLAHPCLKYNDSLRSVEAAYRSASLEYSLPVFEHAAYIGQCECSINITQTYKLGFNDLRFYPDCGYPDYSVIETEIEAKQHNATQYIQH